MITNSKTGVLATPNDVDNDRIALYSEEFAADPHRVYREMRQRYGNVAPVWLHPGVPATLVLSYEDAKTILNDAERFPADPRRWERDIPADCPLLPMMKWRPNPIRSAGADHERYRSAMKKALGNVDLHTLHATIEEIAVPVINSFSERGECDLVGEYALPVTFQTLNTLLGSPPEISQRAAAGMAAMFDVADAERGNQILDEALQELISLKRAEPGADITSWLIEHPVGLDDDEMRHQLVLLEAAGIEPPQHLIANTLRLMLTDQRFAGNVLGGSVSTEDALNEVLFNDPPLSNYCISYPRQPILIENTWLPAHQPVLISIAACNNDPAIRTGDYTNNRSHLAFSTGTHACPARPMAELIAKDAIDQLLDALPEIELAVSASDLRFRPGPFHRALVELPVRFPASPPIHVPTTV